MSDPVASSRYPIVPHIRRIAGGLLTDYGTSTVILAVNFISVPIYLRYLTASQFGVWLAITAFLAVIALADPGLSVYVTKRLAEPALFEDVAASNKFLSAAQMVQNFLVMAILLLGALLYVFGLRPATHEDVTPILILTCVATALIDIGCALNGAIITARMRFADVYLINMLRVVLAFAFSTALLASGLRIQALAYGTVLASVLANLTLYLRRHSQFPQLAIGFVRPREAREYLKAGRDFVWSFQVLRITQLARVGFMPIFFASAGGPAALANLNITGRIPQIIPQYISKLAIQFFPYLSSMAGSPNEEARSLFFVFNAVVIRLSLFCAVLVVALNRPFVSLWVGDQYFTDQLIFGLIIIAMLRESFFGCAGVFLYANSNFGRLSLVCCVDAFISIGGGYLAARYASPHLVLVASVAGSLLSLAFVYAAILRHQSVRISCFLSAQFRVGLRYACLPTAATVVGAVLIREYATIDSWPRIAAAIVCLGIINLVVREVPLFIGSQEKLLRKRLFGALRLADVKLSTYGT